MRVRTDVPGTEVSVDGIRGGDVRRTVIAGARVTIAAEPVQAVGGAWWTFGGWSDGAFPATRVLTPASDVAITAHFEGEPGPAPEATAAPAPIATPAPGATPTPAPPLRVAVDRARTPRVLAPRIPLLVRCSRACRVSAAARLLVGRAAHRLPAPESVARPAGRRLLLRVPARLRAPARDSLRRGRAVSVRLALTVRGAAGEVRRRTATVPLRLS